MQAASQASTSTSASTVSFSTNSNVTNALINLNGTNNVINVGALDANAGGPSPATQSSQPSQPPPQRSSAPIDGVVDDKTPIQVAESHDEAKGSTSTAPVSSNKKRPRVDDDNDDSDDQNGKQTNSDAKNDKPNTRNSSRRSSSVGNSAPNQPANRKTSNE